MENTIIIQNIQEFSQKILDGNLVLTRIQPFVDEATLFENDLSRSHITECKFNNNVVHIRNYNQLLICIYYSSNMETLFQNTILNIMQDEFYEKGFRYYDFLGISIQGANTRRLLKEIINITKIQNFKLELKIKLKNNEIIRFNI